jgi:hypothetical protein
LAALSITVATPAFAGTDSPLSSAKKPGTTEVHAQTKDWYLNDEIGRCDTDADTYTVYANFSYNGISGSTPQWEGGNGTCKRWDMGTIGAGVTVSQRAAVQVDGGSNWYGSWVSGVS